MASQVVFFEMTHFFKHTLTQKHQITLTSKWISEKKPQNRFTHVLGKQKKQTNKQKKGDVKSDFRGPYQQQMIVKSPKEEDSGSHLPLSLSIRS